MEIPQPERWAPGRPPPNPPRGLPFPTCGATTPAPPAAAAPPLPAPVPGMEKVLSAPKLGEGAGGARIPCVCVPHPGSERSPPALCFAASPGQEEVRRGPLGRGGDRQRQELRPGGEAAEPGVRRGLRASHGRPRYGPGPLLSPLLGAAARTPPRRALPAPGMRLLGCWSPPLTPRSGSGAETPGEKRSPCSPGVILEQAS